MTIKAFKITDQLPERFKKDVFKKRFISASALAVKAFDPEKEMVIEGVANGAAEDRCSEQILPQAWDFENYKKNPIILIQHDQNRRVGTCVEFSADKEGLHCRALIGDPTKAPLTQLQMDTRSEIAQGILKAFSVGFLPRTVEYDEESETLRYTSVELLEISLVSIPMQQDSLVTSVKSFEGKKMDNLNTKGEPNEGGPDAQLKELKEMASDHKKCLKDMHKSLKDLHDKVDGLKGKAAAPSDDDGDEDDNQKAIQKLKDDNRKLRNEVKELTESSEALLSELKKQGVIKEQGDK